MNESARGLSDRIRYMEKANRMITELRIRVLTIPDHAPASLGEIPQQTSRADAPRTAERGAFTSRILGDQPMLTPGRLLLCAA